MESWVRLRSPYQIDTLPGVCQGEGPTSCFIVPRQAGCRSEKRHVVGSTTGLRCSSRWNTVGGRTLTTPSVLPSRRLWLQVGDEREGDTHRLGSRRYPSCDIHRTLPKEAYVTFTKHLSNQNHSASSSTAVPTLHRHPPLFSRLRSQRRPTKGKDPEVTGECKHRRAAR